MACTKLEFKSTMLMIWFHSLYQGNFQTTGKQERAQVLQSLHQPVRYMLCQALSNIQWVRAPQETLPAVSSTLSWSVRTMQFRLYICYLNDLMFIVPGEIGIFGKLQCPFIGVRKPPWSMGSWFQLQPLLLGERGSSVSISILSRKYRLSNWVHFWMTLFISQHKHWWA